MGILKHQVYVISQKAVVRKPQCGEGARHRKSWVRREQPVWKSCGGEELGRFSRGRWLVLSFLRLDLRMGSFPLPRISLGHVMRPEFCLFQWNKIEGPSPDSIRLAPGQGSQWGWNSGQAKSISGGPWWTQRCVMFGRPRMLGALMLLSGRGKQSVTAGQWEKRQRVDGNLSSSNCVQCYESPPKYRFSNTPVILICCVFIFIQFKILPYFSFSLAHGSFRRMLFSSQIFMDFIVIFLFWFLIFFPLWSEKIFGMT